MSSLDADARRLSTMQAEHVVPNAKGNLDVGNGKASENNQEQLKNSPLTMEDIWRVLNEVKSSVDQVLLGVSNAKYQVKEGDPVREFFCCQMIWLSISKLESTYTHPSRSFSPPEILP